MGESATILGWFLLIIAINSVFVWLIGYPVIWHVGSALLSPMQPMFEVAKTLAIWGAVLSILFGRWKLVAVFLIGVVLISSGASLLEKMLLVH